MKCQDCGTDEGDAIFICQGYWYEPVPDMHHRIAGYCIECAAKHGINVSASYDQT
jgi:hypothetical protein